VCGRIKGGEQATGRRLRPRRARVRALENDTVLGEPVDVRCRRSRITIGPDVIGTETIDHVDEHIGAPFLLDLADYFRMSQRDRCGPLPFHGELELHRRPYIHAQIDPSLAPGFGTVKDLRVKLVSFVTDFDDAELNRLLGRLDRQGEVEGAGTGYHGAKSKRRGRNKMQAASLVPSNLNIFDAR
jgi:hypothetical protein